MESIEYNITHNIEIDPVYGTETISTTQIDSTSSPFNSTVIPPTTEFRVVTFNMMVTLIITSFFSIHQVTLMMGMIVFLFQIFII